MALVVILQPHPHLRHRASQQQKVGLSQPQGLTTAEGGMSQQLGLPTTEGGLSQQLGLSSQHGLSQRQAGLKHRTELSGMRERQASKLSQQ